MINISGVAYGFRVFQWQSKYKEMIMDRILVGILCGIITAILVRLSAKSYKRYKEWCAFQPFNKIWSPFTKGATYIFLTGKPHGHTLKISANERDAASLITKLLPSEREPIIVVANHNPTELHECHVIAFGSERDNEVTKALLSSVSPFLKYDYTSDNNLVVNGEVFRSEYRDNILIRDYALVCKSSNPFSLNYKFLVFSGNHGIGTQGAVIAFTSPDPTRKLLERVGDGDFYAVVEICIDKRFGIEPTSINIVRCALLDLSASTKISPKRESRDTKLEKFLEDMGANKKYLDHVRPRTTLALAIAAAIEARGIDLDTDAIFFGSMFHDIGRIASQGIDHGLKGAEIVLMQKDRLRSDFVIMPDTLAKIVECIECHIVGGLRRDWIEKAKLKLPLKDFVPISLEAKIVAFTDQIFHGWDYQQMVFLEAPALDNEVYRQFYALTKSIIYAAYGQPMEIRGHLTD
jgi:HD superfamily phosphodiesterase